MIAAVTALSKFMCVSPQFCDDHLELLFTIMAQSPDPIVKGNLIIALGDIAVSWSTIMDAKSDELYRGLLDKDLTVRKHTFMVLTHLILNQMIKTKGQLGGMAKCLEDDEPRIRDLAQLFFSELATKDNVIYNELPECVGLAVPALTSQHHLQSQRRRAHGRRGDLHQDRHLYLQVH